MTIEANQQSGFLRTEDLDRARPEWFERQVMRCLGLAGWEDLRHVGRSWDGGADIVGLFRGERWLVQVKARRGAASAEAVRDLERAATLYGISRGLAVSRQRWTDGAVRAAKGYGENLQLATGAQLVAALAQYPVFPAGSKTLYAFQEEAVGELQLARQHGRREALIAMATGLGKTVVAAEYVARSPSSSDSRVLVLAHNEQLLKQSERAFWEHLPKHVSTHQLHGRERPHRIDGVTFATFQTMANVLTQQAEDLVFDTVIVDECHHAAAPSYAAVLKSLEPDFLIGLTATPWRMDERSLREIFGDSIFSKSIIEAMNQGWLSEVDYRLLVDNIPWEDLPQLAGTSLPLGQLNSLFFVPQLEQAIVEKIAEHWDEVGSPRALVFCKTIESAERMARLINQGGFARADVVSSRRQPGERRIDREIKLMRFRDGAIDVLCGVDVFNEGIDVPDANLLVFLRVTHSRRIFVQQLGRGLRWRQGKVVRVLDFVSDIRRIAALLRMETEHETWQARRPVEVSLQNTIVHFGNDRQASFFREWLQDVAELEDAGESSVLAFPPTI